MSWTKVQDIFLGAGAGFEPTTSGLSLKGRSPSCVLLFARRSLAPKLALGATPLAKTIHRIVFASLTQRATLVGLITLQGG